MNNLHIKKGDSVVIISGKQFTADMKKSKGKDFLPKRKVLEVSPKEGKVIVEGANIRIKHVKPKKQGEAGGIIKTEGAIYASKVMLVCPKCGASTKTGSTRIDGKNLRVCKACKESF